MDFLVILFYLFIFIFFLNFWYEPLFLAQMAKKPQPNPYAWARSKPEERAVSSINLKKRDHHYFRQLKQFWVRNNTLNCMGRRRWIKKYWICIILISKMWMIQKGGGPTELIPAYWEASHHDQSVERFVVLLMWDFFLTN